MSSPLDPTRHRLRAATVEAVHHIGEDLLGQGQRLAPIEEGTLRAAGDVEFEETPEEIVATISFNTVYAARQHEELDWHHPKGGQAKYLEQPLNEGAARYQHIIALAQEAALR